MFRQSIHGGRYWYEEFEYTNFTNIGSDNYAFNWWLKYIPIEEEYWKFDLHAIGINYKKWNWIKVFEINDVPPFEFPFNLFLKSQNLDESVLINLFIMTMNQFYK